MFHVVLAPCSFPSAVTTVAYIMFWFKVRTSQATGREREAENRAGDSRSDLLSPVIFSFTWLPYPIVLSMMNLCLKCIFFYKLFKDLTMISKFMPLINSFMNRLVYVLRIPEFRGAIRELIWCNRPFRRVGDTPLENMRARNQAIQASSFARNHGN